MKLSCKSKKSLVAPEAHFADTCKMQLTTSSSWAIPRCNLAFRRNRAASPKDDCMTVVGIVIHPSPCSLFSGRRSQGSSNINRSYTSALHAKALVNCENILLIRTLGQVLLSGLSQGPRTKLLWLSAVKQSPDVCKEIWLHGLPFGSLRAGDELLSYLGARQPFSMFLVLFSL